MRETYSYGERRTRIANPSPHHPLTLKPWYPDDHDRLDGDIGFARADLQSLESDLLGLDESRRRAGCLIDEATHVLEVFEDRAAGLEALARFVMQRTR